MSTDASQMVAKLTAFANRIFPVLDRMTYYQLLNVPATADIPTIKGLFYKAAAQLHPDRYHGLPDQEVKAKLETIYARITEAYRVLTTPDKRIAYDKMLAESQAQAPGQPPGPPRVRFEQKDRETKGPRNPEDTLTNPEAKKFFRLAMMCLGKKDWKGAVMNLNFARTFEPSAAIIAAKLAEAQRGMAAKGGGGAGR